MARKATKGRPRIFKANDTGGGYVTAHLRGDQIRFIGRVIRHAGGKRAEGLRQVFDAGMAAMKRAGR